MKGTAAYLMGAVVLALIGALCLASSRLDQAMADAQQNFLASDYAAAATSLDVADNYYQYVRRLPWVGQGPLNEVHARRAAIAYWQRDYDVLTPADRPDPVAAVPSDNVALQLIVANAVYRGGRGRTKDRATTVDMLTSVADAYRTVLGNAQGAGDAPYAEQAAFNYEYVVRLRDEFVKGRRKEIPAPDGNASLGVEGEPENAEFEREFKGYVPLEKQEREDSQGGQFAPPSRKG